MAEFIPVTELPALSDTKASFLDSEGRFDIQADVPGGLAWNVALPPYINADRIEVNMSRVRAIHKVGAIASSLVMQFSGETTKEEPSIVGMTGHGMALAGKSVSVRKGERVRSDLTLVGDYETMPQSIQSDYGKAVAVHALNISEVAQKVQHRGATNETRDGLWAQELSKSLSESYRMASHKHLVEHGTKFDKAWAYSYAAFIATMTTLDIYEQDYSSLPAWFGLALGMNIAADSVRNKAITGDTRIKDRRYSLLVGGVQTDRHLAVHALTHMPGGLMRLRKEPKIL